MFTSKSKTVSVLRWSVSAAVLGVSVVGCSATQSAQGSNKLTIALAAPLSGPSAASGDQMKNGCSLAVENYNAKRGAGPEVSLDVQDDASKPETGINLVARFQQESAVAIIGGYNSPVALAMLPKVTSAQIPFLAQGISSAIKGPWVYHSVPVGPIQAEGTAKYLKSKGASPVGILTDTSSFGTSALPDIESALKGLGLDVAGTATFDVDSSNVTPSVLKVKNAGAKGIVLYTTGGPIARAMIGIEQAGVQVPVVSNFTAADPTVSQIAGPAVDGLIFESIVDPNKPSVKELGGTYTAKYPDVSEIPVYAVVTYDQCKIALAGITSGAKTGPDMKTFLDKFSSSDLASGAAGSRLAYTKDDHIGWKADALVYEVYRGGKAIPCSTASAGC